MITEGLSGIRPAGLSSFSQIRQRDGMALRIVRMFDKSFDTEVRRANGKFCIEAISSGMEAGSPVLGEGVADELKMWCSQIFENGSSRSDVVQLSGIIQQIML